MREQLQEQLEQAQTGRQQLVLAYNALKELDDQVNNVLSAQQEAHGYLNTLQSLSDRQSALANKESSLAQLKQDNETLDAEIQALREQIAGMDPADENLPALNAALAEKEAAYNDNQLTIAQTEAEIAVEKALWRRTWQLPV